MMRTLKDLFDTITGAAAQPSPQERRHTLQLATAVLLIEVMRADSGIAPAEQASAIATLRTKFSLADDELARLMELAAQTAKTANDFFGFTSSINDEFTHAEKIQVVENMWQVAYADAHLAAHENHVVGKVAGLLHVTHGEYIAAKLRARDAAEG